MSGSTSALRRSSDPGSAARTSRSRPSSAWCSSRAGTARAVAQVQLDVDPVGQPAQRRLRRRVGVVGRERLRREVVGLGQLDRQHRFRQRDRQAGLVVDDRERLAPVALAGEQPVPQPIGNGALTAARCFSSHVDDRSPWRAATSRPSRKSGVDRRTVAEVRPPFEALGRLHGAHDRQVEDSRRTPSRARPVPGTAMIAPVP